MALTDQINAEQVHAARYVGAATVDASYPPRHCSQTVTSGKSGTLADTEGIRDDRVAAALIPAAPHTWQASPTRITVRGSSGHNDGRKNDYPGVVRRG